MLHYFFFLSFFLFVGGWEFGSLGAGQRASRRFRFEKRCRKRLMLNSFAALNARSESVEQKTRCYPTPVGSLQTRSRKERRHFRGLPPDLTRVSRGGEVGHFIYPSNSGTRHERNMEMPRLTRKRWFIMTNRRCPCTLLSRPIYFFHLLFSCPSPLVFHPRFTFSRSWCAATCISCSRLWSTCTGRGSSIETSSPRTSSSRVPTTWARV